MVIENKFYFLELDEKNGNVISYKNSNGTEYISAFGQEALFTLRLLDSNGGRLDVRSDFSTEMSVEKSDNALTLRYENVGDMPIRAKVNICFDDTALVRWNLEVENGSPYAVEWEDFPGMLWENKAAKKYKTFLPLFEGVEIEDFSFRKRMFPNFEPGYPSKGWEGSYPGPVALQFIAYYNGAEGLYLACHDDTLQSKYFDADERWNGLRPCTKFLPGTDDKKIKMPFYTVTATFEGGFYDAAEIYRSFAENSKLMPQKRDRAEWLDNPPLSVLYPVRGEKDTGGLPPTDYYPYTRALPYLDYIKDKIDGNVMVVLFHWEGTAPWCPPYVWPPYGDEADFRKFVDDLHEKGDLFGLYCSGIGWTEKSIFTDYNMEGVLSEKELKETMCLAPDGSLPYAFILNGLIRWGYEMCPTSPRARKIIKEEFKKIETCGVDYVQLFDQNLGGNSSVCYASTHGHPRTPGVWQTKAMRELVGDISENTRTVIGCESAAAEGFNDLMTFNDSRNYYGFVIGTPVPAYAYVYHERLANFMGNQNNVCMDIDVRDNPDNLLYRTAHFFAQGDSLAVVLKNDGKINWDWGTPWEEPDPNQESQFALLKNLLAWRKGNLKNELSRGRMTKPLAIECGEYKIVHKNGKSISYPSVVSTAWDNGDEICQVLVNPFSYEQKVGFEKTSGGVYRTACGAKEPFDGTELRLPPFGVAKLVFEK